MVLILPPNNSDSTFKPQFQRLYEWEEVVVVVVFFSFFLIPKYLNLLLLTLKGIELNTICSAAGFMGISSLFCTL